jgi:hypothetical protein|tara:strand:+ start:382 stop:813 length:432 start_codon:yes stop_codon:yes gene_type:complete
MVIKKQVNKSLLKIKTKIHSIYYFRKIIRSITEINNRISKRGVEIAYITIFFALISGIFNTILEGSNPIYASALIIPNRAAQTWSEVVINFFALTLGSTGAYLLYRSKRTNSPSNSPNFLLLIGLSSILLAAALGLYMVQIKA